MRTQVVNKGGSPKPSQRNGHVNLGHSMCGILSFSQSNFFRILPKAQIIKKTQHLWFVSGVSDSEILGIRTWFALVDPAIFVSGKGCLRTREIILPNSFVRSEKMTIPPTASQNDFFLCHKLHLPSSFSSLFSSDPRRS